MINLQAVLELPVSERIQVVEEIWDSVAKDIANVPLQPWQEEVLDRRVAEFEENPGEGVSWSEVQHRIMGG